MSANMYGIAAYQQTKQTWKKSEVKEEKTEKGKADKTKSFSDASGTEKTENKTDGVAKDEKLWKPVDPNGSLVPVQKEGYGMVIGDVKLSDEAKEYYNKLKQKFHNSDFILVSRDMKSQVENNASAYANPNKLVVLIDEDKIERMAADPSYRDKYEGIIAMAEMQMAQAGNSIPSTGASVKNFGMSVDANGVIKYFAVLEKASAKQKERMEKRTEEKAEEKIKEKKQAEKEEKEKRAERAEKEKAYIEVEADSMEELLRKLQSYAYIHSSQMVMTEEERALGQNFDLRG